jgi:hypothetical protein
MDLGIAFDQLNPNVMDWLNTNALQHATSVTGTVKEELIIRLMAGVEQELSGKDIAASFSEFFDDQSQWRALPIPIFINQVTPPFCAISRPVNAHCRIDCLSDSVRFRFVSPVASICSMMDSRRSTSSTIRLVSARGGIGA